MPLKTLKGNAVRPTTDRTKETLFNMLQQELYGSYFLDLFAGSGQIGLEALSRGSRYAVFVENSKQASACIKDNISFTKSDRESLLVQMDVLAALRFLEGKYQFDIVFMDPPYGKQLEQGVFAYLKHSSLLKEDTLLVLETARGMDVSYLQEAGFAIVREKQYKTNVHLFIKKAITKTA